MQSHFKTLPLSFIDEVQRDLRVATQAANHIIFMGYSLPPDDVSYRAFFAARKQRKEHGEMLRCSVVVGTDWDNHWHYHKDISHLLPHMKDNESPKTTLVTAQDLFGAENVRFFGGGIPQVFCDGAHASRRQFHKLIN